MSRRESIMERAAAQNRRGEWTARNNGAGARPWFCYNERTKEYHYAQGDGWMLVRYTFAGAVKKADELNALATA